MNTELIDENVHRLLGAMTGAATTAMVAVGDQLGLYRALADGGPATQDELAARTGTAARYLREWLSQQAAAGFLAYREGDGRYALAAEAAAQPDAKLLSDEELEAERARYLDEAHRIAAKLRARWAAEPPRWNVPTGRPEIDSLIWFQYVHCDNPFGSQTAPATFTRGAAAGPS